MAVTDLKVISIGDSFLYGLELQDWGSQPSQLTWPALYAKYLQAEYQCLAKSAHSSQYVLRTLLASLHEQTQPCFYIIHWPSAIRTEYFSKTANDWVQITGTSIMNRVEGESELVQKAYYSIVNSLLGDKLHNLLMIYTAVQALKSSHHKFAMSVVDEQDFLYNKDLYDPEYVTFLQTHTEKYIHWFDGMTFHAWSKHNQWPEGPWGHPLEQAHAQAFEYFKDIYNSIITI